MHPLLGNTDIDFSPFDQDGIEYSAPARFLHKFARISNLDDQFSLADDMSTPVQTAMRLARDENVDLRYALAENHNLATSVLELLAEDSNPYVCARAKKTMARLKDEDLISSLANHTTVSSGSRHMIFDRRNWKYCSA
jgi:hypothetical protein